MDLRAVAFVVLTSLSWGVAACSDDDGSSPDASSASDAARADVSVPGDAARTDAVSPVDAGVMDATGADATGVDAVVSDAEVADAVAADAAAADAVVSDAEVADTVAADAVVSDAEVADAVAADAVVSDAEVADAVAADVAVVDAEVVLDAGDADAATPPDVGFADAADQDAAAPDAAAPDAAAPDAAAPDASAPDAGPTPVSFAAVYTQVIAPGCSCHVFGASGGLQMGNVNAAYNNLLNVTALNYAPELRVEPGSSATSVLYLKVSGTTRGSRMPLGGAALTAGQQALIRQWIDDGAAR